LRLRVKLSGSADSLKVKVYTKAMQLIAIREVGGSYVADWNLLSVSLNLPSSGLYYIVVSGPGQAQAGADAPAAKLVWML
jgi:hypothetical protein